MRNEPKLSEQPKAEFKYLEMQDSQAGDEKVSVTESKEKIYPQILETYQNHSVEKEKEITPREKFLQNLVENLRDYKSNRDAKSDTSTEIKKVAEAKIKEKIEYNPTSREKDLQNLVEDLRDYKATRRLREFEANRMNDSTSDSESSTEIEEIAEGNETWQEFDSENENEIDFFDYEEGEADHDEPMNDILPDDDQNVDEIFNDPRGPGYDAEVEEQIEQDMEKIEQWPCCSSWKIRLILLLSVLLIGAIVTVTVLVTKGNASSEKLAKKNYEHIAQSNNTEAAQNLTKKKAKSSRNTPLYLTEQSNSPEVSHMLFEAGADMNALDNDERTALHIAAHSNNAKDTKFLIDAGTDINAKRIDGKTALQIAAKKHRPDVARILIDNGADKFKEARWDTALHDAAHSNNAKDTQFLIDAGADINAMNRYRNTPLHIAAERHSPDAARILIENGANMEARNVDGQKPLHVAVKHNNPNFPQFVIDNGGNTEAKDK
jgi:DNA-binding HxlR family transcriptional regulator